MKCIAIFFILLGAKPATAEMRASCLKANDICRGSDFSVEAFILCGEQPKQNFSIDSSIIAPKGSGFMRKPDQCDGICVDIMDKTDKNKLTCNNAFNVPLWNCSNYRNAKQCVPDVGGWIGIAGAVLVVGTVIGCWITNKKRSEVCQDDPQAAEEKAKAAAGAAKLEALKMKPMRLGQRPNYYP
jgi:hypothetical protein